MHDRLIVGFDGSDASASAVRWAATEAETRHAAVGVISSYSIPPVLDYYGVGAAYVSPAAMQEVQQAWFERLTVVVTEAEKANPNVGFDYHTVDQPIVQALVGAAEEADLLVVGSSGAGAVKGFLLGSVAGAVLHDSPCPVVVVPTKINERVGRVVVGVDGSVAALTALKWAADEADRLGAELVVLHAFEYPYGVTTETLLRGNEYTRVDGALVLDRAVEAVRDQMLMAVEGKLVEGGAAHSLLEAAESADMIVVGSRGRGGFRSMLLGSVAHAVAAHAPCPVVVIR